METKNINKADKTVKKPFDKKKWREQKYSGKYKVQKWQEKRENIAKNLYKKQLRQEGLSISENLSSSTNQQKSSRLKVAQENFEKRKLEKSEQTEKIKKIREEKEKAIQQFRQKKTERFRKLNQKTRKGQPLMRGRMELLQEKIERLAAENKL